MCTTQIHINHNATACLWIQTPWHHIATVTTLPLCTRSINLRKSCLSNLRYVQIKHSFHETNHTNVLLSHSRENPKICSLKATIRITTRELHSQRQTHVPLEFFTCRSPLVTCATMLALLFDDQQNCGIRLPYAFTHATTCHLQFLYALPRISQ